MTSLLALRTMPLLSILLFLSASCTDKNTGEGPDGVRSGPDSVSVRWEVFTYAQRIYPSMLVQKFASDDPIHLRSSYGKEALMRKLSLFAVEMLNGRDPEPCVSDSTQEFDIIVHRDTIRRRSMELVVITLENIGRYNYRIFATITVERHQWLAYIYVPVFGDAIMVEYASAKDGVWLATPCYSDSVQVEYVRTVAQKVLNRHK